MARLMCSKDRTEVESVKKRLFQAGIASEIRSNPLAAALKVNRVELWVQDERDFFRASKLYSDMQARGDGRSGKTSETQSETAGTQLIELNEPQPSVTPTPPVRSRKPETPIDPDPSALDEASTVLEGEIQRILEREAELENACTKLREREQDLSETLKAAKTALSNESADRQAREKKYAEELARLQRAFDKESSQKAELEKQLALAKQEHQQEIKAQDAAIRDIRKLLDNKSLQLEAQQSAVVELRKEIAARKSTWEEQERLVQKARAEAAAEFQARQAAEERAASAEAARTSLETELAAQKEAQSRMHASVARLNALCAKLQSKRRTASGDRQAD